MKKKTGYFVVLDGETFENAVNDHYVGYIDVECALKNAETYTSEGDKFCVYNDLGQRMEAYEIKNGKAVLGDG